MDMYYERLLEQIRLVDSGKIVFFGASLFLEDFLNKYPDLNSNILGIIDNDSLKWGNKIGKYTIYPPIKLFEFQPVYIIFTIFNNNANAYDSMCELLKQLELYKVCFLPNVFYVANKKEFSKTNKIYLIKENNEKEEVSFISGLKIVFNGENNIVEIGANPLPKFCNCNFVLRGNNNFISIGSSSRKIISLRVNFLGNNEKLLIGNGFSIEGGAFACTHSSSIISIGDDCLFSAGIIIRTDDGHTILDNTTGQIINMPEVNSVTIGNHVWFGVGASILKNSKVPDNSIVGKSSVVTKKFEKPNVILAGSPARVVKENINWDRRGIDGYLKYKNNLIST